MSLTYKLSVDLDEDGDYTDTYENVTNDLLYVRYRRGRDSDMQQCSPGIMEFELNNSNKRYSPSYTSSPIYGDWTVGKPVKLEMYKDAGDPWQTVFTGKISRIVPSPHKTEQTCYVYCYDALAELSMITISTEYYANIESYDLALVNIAHTGWPISPVGLEAYYPIVTTVYCGYDFSGHGHTLLGAVSYATYASVNAGGIVFLFNDPAEYTECADEFQIANDFTYSWWARCWKTIANGDVMWDHGYYFHKTGGVLAFTCSLGTISLPDDYNDAVGRRFTIVKSSTDGIKIYVNDTLVASDAGWTGDITTGSDPLTLGNSDVHNTGMFCWIDDFRLYSRCLTGAEILAIYEWRLTIDIDSQFTANHAYWYKESALSALRELEEMEMNVIYIDGEGNLVYNDRYTRVTAAVAATLTNSMIDARYELGTGHIINKVVSSYQPYTEQSSGDIWTLEDTPLIAAGDTLELWGDFSYPCATVTTPVATTDYTANEAAGGGGADLTADLQVWAGKYAKGAFFTLKNTGATDLYVTLLKIRGQERISDDAIEIKREDVSSTVSYGVLDKTIDGRLFYDFDDAEYWCDLYLFLHKFPLADLKVQIDNADASKEQILYDLQNIGDKIAVVCDELGISDNYFVNAIEHEISDSGKYHKLTLTLEDAYAWEYPWILGWSLLGTQTFLG